MTSPRFLDDEAFKCLRAGDLDGYRRAVEGRKIVNFCGADLRATDFRKIDMSKVVLRDAYLRDTDFRGCDLRQTDMEGASLHNAHIAGTYFPENISPNEIQLSIQYGTRLRVEKR
jgi:uncharacterized protein YjbI with pentapeptide repeats